MLKAPLDTNQPTNLCVSGITNYKADLFSNIYLIDIELWPMSLTCKLDLSRP